MIQRIHIFPGLPKMICFPLFLLFPFYSLSESRNWKENVKISAPFPQKHNFHRINCQYDEMIYRLRCSCVPFLIWVYRFWKWFYDNFFSSNDDGMGNKSSVFRKTWGSDRTRAIAQLRHGTWHEIQTSTSLLYLYRYLNHLLLFTIIIDLL